MTREAKDPRAAARPVAPDHSASECARGESEEPTSRFLELLKNADELLRLPRWMKAATAGRAAAAWDGLSVLLNAALPPDEQVEIRLSRALHVTDDTISKLRARQLSPATVPPDSLSRLGRAMHLDWQEFDTLVRRDLEWFWASSAQSVLRSTPLDPSGLSHTLRTAWDHAADDEATGL